MARTQVVEKGGAEVELGPRLRTLRAGRGLTLRAAAALAGVTPGALSQIENGRNSPSVSTLKKILSALGTSLGAFFSPDQGPLRSGFVFRASELVPVVWPRASSSWDFPGRRRTAPCSSCAKRTRPERTPGRRPTRTKCEEGGFCLSGAIEITVAGRREILGPGDAYYYASKLPHRWRNVGRVPAVVISACTPPSF